METGWFVRIISSVFEVSWTLPRQWNTDETGVPVYLAPWTACPPGGKLSRDLTPRPGYLNPRGASCPGRFILPPTHIKKILLCDVYYYLQHYNNYM